MAVSSVFAQLPKRVAAFNYMNSGEFDKAKEAIDVAVENPKTIGDYKSWYYRGTIYLNIAMNKNFQSLDAEATLKSLQSYAKSMTLNFKDIQYQNLDILNKKEDFQKFKSLQNDKTVKFTDDIAYEDIVTVQLPTLSNTLVNNGVVEFKDKQNFAKALELFEKSLFISELIDKLDTPIYYYAALAAEKSNSFAKADKFYDILTKAAYGINDEERASMYYMKARNSAAMKDTAAYIQTLQDGIGKYQNGSSALVTELINHYLSKKQSVKALNYLKLAIEKDPKNPSYYFAQGTLYDSRQKLDSAETAYKKAIELKPDFFDANFNLGALYYNNAAVLIDKANAEKDDTKYGALKKQSDAEFVKAQPYLEKALELNAKDINTMQSLKTLYYRLGLTEKYDAMDAKLKQ